MERLPRLLTEAEVAEIRDGLPLGSRALSDGHVKIEVDTGSGDVTVEPVS